MNSQWTSQKAWDWYNRQPWLVGCNFIPSTAINQLEMWQAETFDLDTITRELSWAGSLGMNTVRTYLHDLLWRSDPAGFKERINRFLDAASRQNIRPLLVIFDDCWNPEFSLGKQPAPKPGTHNSGWVQSPGSKVVTDASDWGRLEEYVHGLLEAFSQDERILLWDLYNEPGNSKLAEKSFDLLQAVFRWAREAGPSQPVSAGVWFDNKTLSDFQVANSDIVTFHDYEKVDHLEAQIHDLQAAGRPLICTEYMARGRGSRFETHLPVFKHHQVGCINWGLVSGKTQTIYAWDTPGGKAEPDPWFHDIFRPDGTPYKESEVAFIRSITGK